MAEDEARDHEKRCEQQAARIAASSVSRGPRDRPLRSGAHYSPKYDQCYVLIDWNVGRPGAASIVVSELWDAFEAVVLATHTAEANERIRRRYCQVALSDDPFTSCLVAKYFIDEHMMH